MVLGTTLSSAIFGISDEHNAYLKKTQKHFQSNGRTKDILGHSSKVHSVGEQILLWVFLF